MQMYAYANYFAYSIKKMCPIREMSHKRNLCIRNYLNTLPMILVMKFCLSFSFQFFETVVRYDRFFSCQSQHIPTVLVSLITQYYPYKHQTKKN